MEKKQILIAGAGSIGTVLGLYLQRKGHHVRLLRRRVNFERINIKLVGVDEFSEQLQISNNSSLDNDFTPDLIFLTSQRQQLPSLLEDILNILGLVQYLVYVFLYESLLRF